MKGFLKETYGYALLLVILFGIASIAVWQTLSFLHEQISGETYPVVTLLIWTLTLGFMLIAGAFGLWAVQFSGQAESRRRIGRIVDAMDYLHDGLLAVDRKGRISGSNPAARAFATLPASGPAVIGKAFPSLSEDDIHGLLHSKEPMELEHSHTIQDRACMLRFRSQPMEGMTLILVSDVTTVSAQRKHNRQAARLQLIGQIARGVAHDFNNILCAVSGHASLLGRLPAGSPDAGNSIRAINQSVERGSALATHLMELARPVPSRGPTVLDQEFLQLTSQALRNSLPQDWKVEAGLENMKPVSLSSVQIEQVVLNIGIQAAEAADGPGTLRVIARPASSDSRLFDVGPQCAGVILISVSDISQLVASRAEFTIRNLSDSGVLLSVIRTMLEEAGGTIHYLTMPGGAVVYRILLPRAASEPASPQKSSQAADLSSEFAALVSSWSVMLAQASSRHSGIESSLKRLSVRLQKVDSVSAVLNEVSGSNEFHAVIVDLDLIGKEGQGLLRAILRLAPGAGIVLLGGDASILGDLSPSVIAAPRTPDLQTLLVAMIESRTLAGKRRRK